MKENFIKAFDFLIKWEGGYSDINKDLGGKTIYGVTQKNFPFYYKRFFELYKQGKTEILLQEVKDFYCKEFWNFCNCNEYMFPIDIFIFDTAVHCGVSFALFIAESKNTYVILLERIKRYIDIVKKKPSQKKFIVGWLNRVISLYTTFKGE